MMTQFLRFRSLFVPEARKQEMIFLNGMTPALLQSLTHLLSSLPEYSPLLESLFKIQVHFFPSFARSRCT